ncbi:ubiquitinyl hydrolase [Aureococcus anophagefferens]|nr:ubiquitinyl hydrolase [Aureococcus anophagefferens]
MTVLTMMGFRKQTEDGEDFFVLISRSGELRPHLPGSGGGDQTGARNPSAAPRPTDELQAAGLDGARRRLRNGANGNGHAAARAPKPQRVLTFVGATTKSGGAARRGRKRGTRLATPRRAKRRRGGGALPAAPPAEADASTTASAVAARRFWAQAAAGRSAGLANLGNTCFLNATIQCLAHTPAVSQTLGDERWPLNPRKRDVAAALRDAPRRSRRSPRQLANRLRAAGRSFQGRQEDAHEFLRALLDAAEPGFAPSRRRLPKRISGAIFGGAWPPTLCCPKCGYKSATEEPFLDLSLEPKPSSPGL